MKIKRKINDKYILPVMTNDLWQRDIGNAMMETAKNGTRNPRDQPS